MSIKLKDQNNNEIFIAGTNSEDFINDKVLRNDKTWSSNKIVEELYPTFQKEGNPIICYPVENYPLNVKATFSPKQAGSGDPSPENVRGISGYDSVKVNVRGKNLFNISKIETSDNVTNNGDGSLTVTTFPNSNGVSSQKTLRELCEGIAPGTYTLNAESTGSEKMVYTPATGYWNFGTSKTLTDEMLDSTLYFYASGIETTATVSNIQLELGSTPTPYEPYQPGTTAQLSLPETIYGGTVNAVTGIGEKTWGYIASYNGESLPGEWISDRDVYASGTTPTAGAQVAYKLATPELFQATGNQALPAVVGLNTVYTDGDSLIISGKEDIKYTINQITSNIQNINQIQEINNILLGVE